MLYIETKLLCLDHLVNIHEKLPQLHQELHYTGHCITKKTIMAPGKTTKSANFLSLNGLVLYSI